MLYNIKLYQYNFDANNENVRLFSNKNERDQYFDSIALFEFNNVNFIANDLIKTTVVLDYSTYALELTKLLNINYCSVANDNERIYFKVMQSQQLSNMRILLNLEIDIIQNYIYDATFDTCLIERAHLNRFYNNGTNYSFDCTTKSLLYKSEDLPILPKRTITRQRLTVQYDTTPNSKLNDWLNLNVSCWIYFYMSPGSYTGAVGDVDPIIYINDAPNIFFQNVIDITATRGATAVFCVPLYKTTDLSIKLSINNQIYDLNYNSIYKWLEQNNNMSNVYTIKYSYLAPFKKDNYNNLYSISTDELTLTLNLSMFANIIPIFNNAYNYFYAIDNDAFIRVVAQEMKPMQISYDLSNVFNQLQFDANYIKTNSNNAILNPKIYDDKVTELVLSDSGNEFSYSIQKLNMLNSSIIFFKYYEMFTPDNTKTLTIYNPINNQSYHTTAESISFNGLCATNDYSVLFSNDKLAEFLANNKNYFVNFLGNSLLDVSKSLISGDAGKIAGAGLQTISGALNIAFTQDNLSNAPDILKNANGNAIFSNAVTDLGIYINIKRAIDCDIQTYNDYTHKYGFTYSQFDKIENHLYTRKTFNYIRANVEGIEGQFSEYVREQMRQLFARGIRFWHINISDYEQQNYEIYLDGDSNGEN